jgi:hypothetical protein
MKRGTGVPASVRETSHRLEACVAMALLEAQAGSLWHELLLLQNSL